MTLRVPDPKPMKPFIVLAVIADAWTWQIEDTLDDLAFQFHLN